MRLYNVEEPDIKVIDKEDYSTFAGLFKNNFLNILLYAYTAYVVIAAALEMIGGMYIMGAINLVVHGCVCAALWIFKTAPKEEDKLSMKGQKLFQIAHAVKYFVMFVLLVVFLILLLLAWIHAGNEAKKALVEAKSQTDASILAAAKKASSAVFWKYFGLLFGYLAAAVAVLVYYRAVMKVADGYQKYLEKGTHFWGDLKFFAYYGFVSAGLIVLYSVLSIFLQEKIIALITTSNVSMLISNNILALIPNILFAVILVLVSIQALKGYKVLDATTTTFKVTIDRDTHKELRVATEEDIQVIEKYEAELLKAISDAEEDEAFVSNELMYDEETIKNTN